MINSSTPPSLGAGIIATVVGFAIGMGLSLLISANTVDPTIKAIGRGIAFFGFFTGTYWLNAYWRWKERKEDYRALSFVRHLLFALVASAILVGIDLLARRL